MIAALVEGALLWTAAAAALRFDFASQSPAPTLYAILALTGLAMPLFLAGILVLLGAAACAPHPQAKAPA